jgi:ribonuclease HI
MSPVNVYCDGSLAPTEMSDPHTSGLGSMQVGRILIVVPASDYDCGLFEKVDVTTCSGAEAAAIRRAIEFCEQHGLSTASIWSDAQGSVSTCGDSRVRWKKRNRNPAGLLFDRLFRRARYLRRTEGKVSGRHPLTAAQLEIHKLLKSESERFILTKSALWKGVLKLRRGEHTLYDLLKFEEA